MALNPQTRTCSNCGGTGRLWNYLSPDPRKSLGIWVTCETCGGTGQLETGEDEEKDEMCSQLEPMLWEALHTATARHRGPDRDEWSGADVVAAFHAVKDATGLPPHEIAARVKQEAGQ